VILAAQEKCRLSPYRIIHPLSSWVNTYLNYLRLQTNKKKEKERESERERERERGEREKERERERELDRSVVIS
jgi:hypothetical protein